MRGGTGPMNLMEKDTKMMRRLLAATLLAAGLLTGIHAAPDWPQFRGPNRDDVSKETGLLQKWPKDGLPLVWKGTGVGDGYSSIAVAGDHIYTLGNKRSVTQLHALDRESGKLLWSIDVGSAGGNLGCTP